MFYGCRNPWVDFKYKYKFIIFSTRILLSQRGFCLAS